MFSYHRKILVGLMLPFCTYARTDPSGFLNYRTDPFCLFRSFVRLYTNLCEYARIVRPSRFYKMRQYAGLTPFWLTPRLSNVSSILE